MPVLRPCIEAKCGALTPNTRCIAHQQQRDRERNERSYYQTPEWRRLRKAVAGRPCAVCESRKRVVAHHREGRKAGGEDVAANLIPLCGSCHSTYEADLRAGRDTELVRLVEAL